MLYKRSIFFLGLILGFIAAMNYVVARQLMERTPDFNSATKITTKTSTQINRKVPTKSAVRAGWKETDKKELEKYGITTTSWVDEPNTPEQWEIYIEKNLNKYKVFETKEGQEALKLMATKKEDFKKQMDQVDKDIATILEWQKKDPENKIINQQLQNLYKIKAIGNVLKDDVIKAEKSSLESFPIEK